MRILVAVKSCQRDIERGCHQVIRETWGSKLPENFDLLFFVGEGVKSTGDDEVPVKAPDAYKALSLKVNEILRGALGFSYDYIVLVDTDTFINPDALAALPWGDFDYTGMWLTWEGGFAFGGCGFAISAKAAQVVVDSPIQNEMDDVSIGNILGPECIKRNLVWIASNWNRRIGWHFPKNVYSAKTYDPQFPWMQMMYDYHVTHDNRAYTWTSVIGGAQRIHVLALTGEDRER
jgi:hypothetical protein